MHAVRFQFSGSCQRTCIPKAPLLRNSDPKTAQPTYVYATGCMVSLQEAGLIPCAIRGSPGSIEDRRHTTIHRCFSWLARGRFAAHHLSNRHRHGKGGPCQIKWTRR